MTTLTAHKGAILHMLEDPLVAGDQAWQHYPEGAFVLEDGYVKALGNARDLLPGLARDVSVTDHGQGLIVPGFVDTHVHYPQTDVMASYGTQLLDWLQDYTFPAEQRFAELAHAEEVSKFFLDQLLRNGTTTAMVFGTSHAQSVNAFFSACKSRALRMICGKVMMDRNAPPELCDTPASSDTDSRDLIRRWHGQGRLGYAVTPRFAPTSSTAQLEVVGQLLDDFPDVHLQTHLSENHQECAWVASLFPERDGYLDVYDHYGLVGSRSVFAHCLHLNEREWNRMSSANAAIAFCPMSNLFVGSGLFDYARASARGIRVGLGTDVGAGDSFSILRTINEAYKVLQLQGQNLAPMSAFYLATLGGARTLSLDSAIGNFETGKEADFIILDTAATALIERRCGAAADLQSKLFSLMMLGDDRCIKETWIMGQRQHQR